MRHISIAALMLCAAVLPAPAFAQPASTINQAIAGTRLDVSATGEVTRVPDIATISAGVTTRSATPSRRFNRRRPDGASPCRA